METMREFCKKHAIISCVVITLICVASWYYMPWGEMLPYPYSSWASYGVRILICVLMMGLLGIGKTAGFQKVGFAKGLLYGIPFYFIGIGSAVISNWGIELGSLQFISWKGLFLFTITMILVGANEEIWIRGVLLNLLREKFGTSTKANWKAILISSLIFGAIHFTNISSMGLANVIVQIISSLAAGTLFGAIYIKTGNLFSVIIIHALVDWLALVIGDCFTGASTVLSVSMTPLIIIISITGGIFIPTLSAVFLLKPKKD